jgi:hypothetical protein
MGRLARRFTILSLAMLLLLLALWVGGSVYARRQAETVVQEFQGLDAAADPTAFSLSFIRRYSNRLAEKVCQFESCQYQFLFTNSVISTLHFVPRAYMKVYVTLDHGLLSFAAIEYTSAVFKQNSPIVWVQEDFCAKVATSRCDYFYLDPHGRDVTETWHGDVQFGQMATRNQKAAAEGLNVDCVTALHGCKDISELLPRVWKLTSPGAVSSRMRSLADSFADASQPLPE